ncbi:LacI family DNA-binding transcriptional regulator, partial [bacterium]|nr:LacI family DNA-binding transcriptional regulator [bacterium]
MKEITMKDIAREAGVSYTAVSLTLSGKGDEYRIKKETQKKILKIAEKLGYSRNIFASYLKKKRSDFVGIVGSSYRMPVRHYRQNLIAEKLKKAGYNIIIQDFHWRIGDPVSIIKEILELRVCGLIVSDPDFPSVVEYLKVLKKRGIVIVLVDGPVIDGFDQVRVSREKMTYLGIKHLFDCGYKNIYFTLPQISRKTYWAVKERYEGFKKIMKEKLRKEKKLEEYLIWHDGDCRNSYEIGYKIGNSLKKRKNVGIMGLNDQVAIGLMKRLVEKGVKIPEEAGIVGSENLPESEFSYVSLTTINFQIEKLASKTVDIFLKRIGGEKGKEFLIEIEPELIVRESTRR